MLNNSVCKSPDKSGRVERDVNIAAVYADSIKPIPANDSQQILNKSKIKRGDKPQTISTVSAFELVGFAKTLI